MARKAGSGSERREVAVNRWWLAPRIYQPVPPNQLPHGGLRAAAA